MFLKRPGLLSQDPPGRSPLLAGPQPGLLVQAVSSFNTSSEQLLPAIRRLLWMKMKNLLYNVFFKEII